MRVRSIGFSLLVAVTICAAPRAEAQPYCAMYTDGEENCGIPTWQSCLQSISGVGGYCTADATSAPHQGFFARQQAQSAASSSEDEPGGLNWMPPPPDE